MSAPTMTAKTVGRSARSRGRFTNLGLVGVTAAIILAVAYMANQPSPGSSATFTRVNVQGGTGVGGPVVGQPAPDFSASTDDGKTLKLASLVGSPVWLTFGASWCQPCRAENPDIQAAWARYREKGLQLVQVFYTEDQATVARYAQTVGLTYTRIPDPNSKLAAGYRIAGIPTHFFIDKTGVLRQITSSTLDPAAIEAALKEIIG